tara:strand:+ start:1912 stop:2394 length:483 start_codon:yes stop_codon:yes gene_type:complete
MTWPNNSKANTTHTDQDTDLVSLARPDINQNILNVNAIIDYYGTGAYSNVGEYTKQQYADLVTLTPGSSVNWDLNVAQTATLTLNQATVLNNPNNQAAGATSVLIIKQPAGANYSLSFGSNYKFPGGVAPTITPSNGAVDVLTFISDGVNLLGGYSQDIR